MEVGEEAMRLVHAKRPNSRGQINSATSVHSPTQKYKNATIGPQMLAHSLR